MLESIFAVVLIFGTAIFFTSVITIAELSRIETLLRDIKNSIEED